MRISVFPDALATAVALADTIVAALTEHPALVLGLPTGRTPQALYAELRRRHAAGEVSFARARTFNLDEFAGIDARHEGSYRRYMEQQLFADIDIARHAVHFLNGAAPDLDLECARYDRALEALGGIDLLVLGIGADGHIGFNEPADALLARSHRVVLAETTRRDNAALFGGDIDRVPREALSMGMGAILKARRVALIAVGAHKARCVERAVNGPVTTRLPASFLQLHPSVGLYLDEAAARLLDAR